MKTFIYIQWGFFGTKHRVFRTTKDLNFWYCFVPCVSYHKRLQTCCLIFLYKISLI